MKIKRIIDKNQKLIWYIAMIIIFALFAIRALNSYYESDERRKIEEAKNAGNNQVVETPETTPDDYSIESNSIEKTMRSFVKYCNDKEIENAYKMLTEECKNAMFPTVEAFEKIYINNVFKINREYELVKWSTDGNMTTYQVTFYGDFLATGNTSESKQEYYTFVEEDNGNYKLNINNYIYGEERNIEETKSNIKVKINHVDIYEEYERATITITNNKSKTICLTGDKYRKNIYLQNSKNTTYSSLNSEFDNKEIILKPNESKTFTVDFNKFYNGNNNANYLVLSDIILDYEEYLNSNDKSNYLNRTNIKMQYQK